MRRNSNPLKSPGKESDPVLTSLFQYLDFLIPPLIYLVYGYARTPVSGTQINEIPVSQAITGMAVDETHFYVSSAGMLRVFNRDELRCIHKWDLVKTSEKERGLRWDPGHVVLDWEHIYVADTKAHRISVVNKETGFLRFLFGSNGLNEIGAGDWEPGYLALDDDHLYACEGKTHEIYVFTKQGEFIKKGKKPPQKLPPAYDKKKVPPPPIPNPGIPPLLAVDENCFYVLNLKGGGINVLKKDTGKKIRTIGGKNKKYFNTIEKTKQILGLTVDDYYLYVSHTNIIIFNKKTGELCDEWGNHESAVHIWRPSFSVIFRDIFYVNVKSSRYDSVQIFR